MTSHKHAHLMAQYAQDALETETPWERWEWKGVGGWYPLDNEFTFSIHYEYRRKPRTLTYSVTIPEPLREAPELLGRYWLAQLSGEYCTQMYWHGREWELWRLKRGLCFATKEDAIAAAKAMLPIKGGRSNMRSHMTTKGEAFRAVLAALEQIQSAMPFPSAVNAIEAAHGIGATHDKR